jgi:hypothetical protein
MESGKMPAMPLPLGGETTEWQQGLTKREMMAMHMMAGIIVGCDSPNTQWCASIAVDATEKLLAELERTKCQR